jgi:plasmid stabilization system protein ParE
VKLIVSRAAAADVERLRVFLEDKSRAAAERAVGVLTRANSVPSATYQIAGGRPVNPAFAN